jgi:fatty acid CoA ligase FadD9
VSSPPILKTDSFAGKRQQYFIALTYGGRIGFGCGDASRLFEDARLLRPSYMSAAPRVWNEVHAQYKHALAEKLRSHRARGLPDPYEGWQELFAPSRERYFHEKATGRVQWETPGVIAEFEDDVLEDFRHILGDRVQYIVTGGAATSEAVLAFLRECFSCPVFDGFGTTETAGITNDGSILPDVDAILEDLPDLGYTNADKPYPRGEICVKTPFVISSYYKDPETTQNSFTQDGYFRTGDVGMRVEPGKIIIIDRRKQVFKLSQGEFVAPERLEHLFIEADLVDQIFVYGDIGRSQVVAIVSPNMSAARAAILRRGDSESSKVEGREDLSDEEFVGKYADRIRADLFVQLREIGNAAGLQAFEIPVHLLVVPDKWTPENNLMTPSWKLKRRAVEERYRNDIEALYKAADETRLRIQRAVLEGASGDATTNLRDMGMDSLGTVRLSQKLREQFGASIPMSLLSSDDLTAERIADFYWKQQQAEGAEQQLGSQAGVSDEASVAQALRDRQSELPLPPHPELDQLRAELASREAGVVQCLLTGCTGFLGAWVLKDILENTDWRVTCLVRAGSDEQASERLREALRRTDSDDPAGRVEPVLGDLSEPRLGFGNEKWPALVGGIDVVLHCGATVNWLDSYSKLRAANFSGTLEVLRFCTTQRLKPLHYVSSIGVAGHYESQMVQDAYLSHLNGYSLTKYAAECVVGRAMSEHKLPISISRPGMITGHSVSGDSNREDFVARYLLGLSALKATPEIGDEQAALDMTPVDYVAASVAALCQMTMTQPSSLGKVYHLVNPRPVLYREIHSTVRELTGAVELSYQEWRRRVAEADDNALTALLPYFPESGFVMFTPPFDKTNSEWLQGESGLQCPPADSSLVKTYVNNLAHERKQG